MVNYMRKQLADHSAGEVILPAKEKSDIERRLDIFSRKLDMLQTDLQEMVSSIFRILNVWFLLLPPQTCALLMNV